MSLSSGRGTGGRPEFCSGGRICQREPVCVDCNVPAYSVTQLEIGKMRMDDAGYSVGLVAGVYIVAIDEPAHCDLKQFQVFLGEFLDQNQPPALIVDLNGCDLIGDVQTTEALFRGFLVRVSRKAKTVGAALAVAGATAETAESLRLAGITDAVLPVYAKPIPAIMALSRVVVARRGEHRSGQEKLASWLRRLADAIEANTASAANADIHGEECPMAGPIEADLQIRLRFYEYGDADCFLKSLPVVCLNGAVC